MTRHNIKNRIISSYSSSFNKTMNGTPQPASIKEACMNIQQETEMPKAYTTPRRSIITGAGIRWAMAFAAMALLFVTCIHLASMTLRYAPSSKTEPYVSIGVIDVIIDVNPSVELLFDGNDHVVACEALNEDAEKILEGMDLIGTDSNVAFHTIVGLLYLNGYLQGNTDAMLVSVDADDESELERIEEVLSGVMENSPMAITVVIQSMDKEALAEEAGEQQISPGKLELINRIVDLSDEYTDESVNNLSTQTIQYLTGLYRRLTSPQDSDQNTGTVTPIPQPDTPDKDSVSDVIDETISDVGNITDDTIKGAGQIVDDTLNTVDGLVEDTLNTAGTIVDETLNTTETIVDETLNTAGNIVDGTLDTVGTIVDETLNTTETIVDETLNTAGSIVEGSIQTADSIFKEALENARREVEKIFIIIH